MPGYFMELSDDEMQKKVELNEKDLTLKITKIF